MKVLGSHGRYSHNGFWSRKRRWVATCLLVAINHGRSAATSRGVAPGDSMCRGVNALTGGKCWGEWTAFIGVISPVTQLPMYKTTTSNNNNNKKKKKKKKNSSKIEVMNLFGSDSTMAWNNDYEEDICMPRKKLSCQGDLHESMVYLDTFTP